MSYLLFLDDERVPKDVTWVGLPPVYESDWTIVRSFHKFVQCVEQNGVPRFITFDHDLGDNAIAALIRGDEDFGDEKTGFHCAVWLVEYCHSFDHSFPPFQVHSMNPIGAKKIRDYIENATLHGYIRRLQQEESK